jgi:uncharacterized membrane protein
MTNPNNANAKRRALPQWKSWWLLPLIYVALGVVILVAQSVSGDTRSGVVWFAVMAGVAALYALGGKYQVIRQARGDFEDERDTSINRKAMAATGTILVIVLTGCIVFELARGNNPAPYSTLMAIGGVTYIAALLIQRYRF